MLAASLPAGAAETSIGIEPLFVVGKHDEPGYHVSGAIAGALGEFRFRDGPIEFAFEGVPGISPHAAQRPGEAGWPSVSIMQFQLRGFITKSVYLSIGEAVYNQATPFYTPTEIEYTDSRVVGGMYGAGFNLPLHGRMFLIGDFSVMPHLNGVISYRQTPYKEPATEYASNVETQLGVGWHYKHTDLLAGLRGFNFAANFDRGDAADRNVGYGIFIEGRYVFGR